MTDTQKEAQTPTTTFRFEVAGCAATCCTIAAVPHREWCAERQTFRHLSPHYATKRNLLTVILTVKVRRHYKEHRENKWLSVSEMIEWE
ncbi:MAG TPA: hypothetical protein VFY63_15320 [Pseudorhizobium sp.]|nr:hypothetical protein [Pseudorhizobium sp.]